MKRSKKYSSKKRRRLLRPSILRPLKMPIGDGSQVVKLHFYIELRTTNNGSNAWIALGPDGYFSSSGRADADVINLTRFNPYINREFDKMGAAYELYTIVGLKAELTPHHKVNGWINFANIPALDVYVTMGLPPTYSALCKGLNDFMDRALTLTDINNEFMLLLDKVKIHPGTEPKVKMYCRAGYYIDNACVKKYLRTNV